MRQSKLIKNKQFFQVHTEPDFEPSSSSFLVGDLEYYVCNITLPQKVHTLYICFHYSTYESPASVYVSTLQTVSSLSQEDYGLWSPAHLDSYLGSVT